MIPCPANCGREQKPEKFLCLPCWHWLPGRIRVAILRTWGEVQDCDPKRDPVGYRQKVRAYRLARADALQHLQANPAPSAKAEAEELFTTSVWPPAAVPECTAQTTKVESEDAE